MREFGSSTAGDRLHAEAEYTHFAGKPVPAHYGNPSAEYSALKEGAAVVGRSLAGIRLTGRDPAGMLDAVLTNDVPEEESHGAYALLLGPKGGVQTDLRVLKRGDEVLLLTEPEGEEAALSILSRYAPFSRVQLESLGSWGVLGVYGPRAAELLGHPELQEHETAEVEVGGAPILAAGVSHPVGGYDLLGPDETLREASEVLVSEGAKPTGLHAYETVRIEAGTPRFGADITPENFPAEAGILDRAVSFSKGCYPGQETVARMYYRGHPNRALRHFEITGDSPPPETPISQNEKQVGRITSVAPLPVNGKVLALGYLHRKADPDAPLTAGGSGITVQARS